MSKSPVNEADLSAMGSSLKKAEINKAGGVDPNMVHFYEKVFTDCGGMREKIGEQLNVAWSPSYLDGGKYRFPTTSKDFGMMMAQGKLSV